MTEAQRSLDQLRAAEDAARIRVSDNAIGMASAIPLVRAKHAEDWTAGLNAYRSAVERRVRAEDEANFLTPPRRALSSFPDHPNAGTAW